MGVRMLAHWSQMLQRISMGENTIKKHTPLWQRFMRLHRHGECGQIIWVWGDNPN